jgi:hypothetical protein
MMDEKGNELWASDNMWGITYLSDESDVVVELECGEGGCGRAVIFHDKHNPKGKKVIPDVDEYARIVEGYLSEDGNYLIVKYMAQQKPDILVFFDVLAKKALWIKQFESRTVREVEVSTKGNYVIVGIYKSSSKECYIDFFNKYGNLIFTKKPEHIGNFSFDFTDDEKFMVVASSKGELYLFDMESDTLLWRYFTGDKNIGFLDSDMSSGFIAASVTTKNPKNRRDGSLPRYLYIFDYKGKLLLSREFKGHGLDSWGKGLMLSIRNSGKKIRVMSNDKLLEFENEFAK